MENAVPAGSPAPETTIAVPVVSLRELAPWALFALAMLSTLYFVGVVPADQVHELLHDGRHLLGFPCH
jgi:cobalt transporter subunit CbtB